jgi:phosphoribosylformylglycinamidine cyclo-ligase
VVEKDQIIDGSHIRAGDQVLGLASSGLHSNGYSLARAVLERSNATLDQPIGETTLGEALLAPTRIYVRPILALLKAVPIHGIAHITGGGLPGNIPRILPGDCDCRIDTTAWPRSEIFQWLQSEGSIDDTEMLRTFNCGIGLVIIVSSDTAAQAQQMLEASGEAVYRLGEVQAGGRGIVFD